MKRTVISKLLKSIHDKGAKDLTPEEEQFMRVLKSIINKTGRV